MNLKVGLGLFRDVVAAAIALGILFGLKLSDDQVAGILLLTTTLGAFGTWLYDTVAKKSA